MYSTCVLTKGKNRSALIDLERQSIQLIPNDLFEILINYNGFTLKEIKANFSPDNLGTIDEYYNFLFENDYVFCTNTPNLFPPISKDWDAPEIINNCIIDIGPDVKFDYAKIFKELDDLHCKFLEIRVFSVIEFHLIEEILKHLNYSTIIYVNMLLPYSEDISLAMITELCDKNARLGGITVYNSPYEKHEQSEDYAVPINYIKQVIIDCKSCGNISSEYFAINIKDYTEFLNFNSCLNRKISIDQNGNIKNCPSFRNAYGNISDTSLYEVAMNESFRHYWSITKEKIDKCKSCEFRHVCTDCRAYLEDPNDLFSAPLKCGYNPETLEWEDWSKNPLKSNAIEYYSINRNEL